MLKLLSHVCHFQDPFAPFCGALILVVVACKGMGIIAVSFCQGWQFKPNTMWPNQIGHLEFGFTRSPIQARVWQNVKYLFGFGLGILWPIFILALYLPNGYLTIWVWQFICCITFNIQCFCIYLCYAVVFFIISNFFNKKMQKQVLDISEFPRSLFGLVLVVFRYRVLGTDFGMQFGFRNQKVVDSHSYL